MDIRDDNCSIQTRSTPTELCTSSNEEATTTHDCESSLHDNKSNLEIFHEDPIFPASSVHQMEIAKEPRIMPGNQISSEACTDAQLDKLARTSCLVGAAVVLDSENADQYAYEDDMCLQHSVNKCSHERQPTFEPRFDGVVTINRHALAGALAGTAVSVSLHPVDTVKTIIQANSCGQSSFYHTLRHTLVERGVLGLYGGLASKLACSAPISAIYTLTYEIVKGALLPVLPKEYHSIAHCVAGGCSSIATSFVFTPSECIKQQMQVGSQYQNCWNALVGCLKRGGIASLYAGWGAVLCRNIPHSIVKFYAYESLKQSILKSAPDNSKLSSGETLLCGGFAGSTAALCTTPFDVVKTRVQLRALSPVSKYDGVLHALKVIFRQEGLRGLYRYKHLPEAYHAIEFELLFIPVLYSLRRMSFSKQSCFLNKRFLQVQVAFDHDMGEHVAAVPEVKNLYWYVNLMN
ncbi:S-adenosylmethionine carrier 1, chloroplastic/mitochondrial [Dichanthelium oligosanthes]|uniref:S-adenosylmethionine carrier 1, chloroplastic/mitochondrial n=1 Tax=Dichanthelium oligosanthes TaxID=888268 RepID=A0A1E5VAC5_9POAL|nr:S-adenosylmethionine carrier 1, chloroplastic/mitochondrial [Dichanthelium oligosanthes]